MVAEAWIVKMGNQVSANLKNALLNEPSSNKRKNLKKSEPKQTIGILSFEVATVISKTLHLYKSMTDSEISKLKSGILKSEGVKKLVSSDEKYLLDLALAEKLDDLNRIASIVSRLGKKCNEPALQGFEHVYGDVINGVIDVKELGFLIKDMDSMARKLERYVNATSNLYNEMEVLNELEQGSKKFQQNQHEESRKAFEQKLVWQKQDVRHLKEISLWNQTYDKVMEMLVRTVCTIFARICLVFGDSAFGSSFGSIGGCSPSMKNEHGQVDVDDDDDDRVSNVRVVSRRLKRVLSKKSNGSQSKHIEKHGVDRSGRNTHRDEMAIFRDEDFRFPCGSIPGKLFMECLTLNSSLSDDDDGRDDRSSQISSCCSIPLGGLKRDHPRLNGAQLNGDHRQGNPGPTTTARFGPKTRLASHTLPSTIGGAALGLHYANIIIVIEKLLRYPHLVGEEARDDLYQMLPTTLRTSLKTNLKSYVKNLAIYDAPLAHDWKERLDGVLGWLAPLAHNMIRWQTERNFEQHQIITRTNVLLLQTLYFADKYKTETAICELLVGLNYICRYEHQQNALLDCASSFDYEDCMEWHAQYGGASYLN